MLVIYFHGNGLHQGLKISCLKEKQSLVVQSTKEYSKSNKRMTIQNACKINFIKNVSLDCKHEAVRLLLQKFLSMIGSENIRTAC